MRHTHLLVGLLSGCAAAVAAIALTASGNSRHNKPELPIMQSFSATPRFDHTVEIFGTTIDLSRYDRHERYERELTGLCYTHNTTLLTIKRANRYMPLIEPILKDEDVPADFIYLAAVESSFNPRALSGVKAAGIWQFMPETGKRYGLEINDEVDERYNLDKATHAACRYLKEAYAKYGDWVSVAASYNAGQARISRQLNDQNVDTALDLLLNDETSRYIFRIMALKEVLRDPYRYGYVIYGDQLYKPIKTHHKKIHTGIADMTAFAAEHHLTYAQLKDFNPWLRSSKLTNRTGKTYTLLLPDPDDLCYDGKPFHIYNKHWVVDR